MSFYRRICLVNNANIVEAVGTFQNGILNGHGKVKFKDGTCIISEFRNGVPFGVVRKWDADKTLKSLMYVEKNLKVNRNRQWRVQENYLIWTEEFSTFYSGSVTEFLTFFIPLDLSSEILVGEFDPVLRLAKDLHSVNVQINSKKNDCFLDLTWTKLERKTFDLISSNGKMIKIEHLKDNACPNFGTRATSEIFKKWQNRFAIPTQFAAIDINITMLKFLHGVKPLNEIINEQKVTKPFMTLKHIYFEDNVMKANISHWKGETLPWIVNTFGFDPEGQLHGVCQFELVPDYYNQTGTNDFFHWSINGFSGRFIHGKLEGLVGMTTWQGNVMMASFTNGEMHGPAISYGRSPAYDIWVSNLCFRLKLKTL